MSWTRRLLAVGALTAGVVVTATGTAGAHGSLYGPTSRIAACYAEGPEHPQSQVCKDLVAMSGTQPLYDWNEVNIADANGRSQQIIPDGKLCSANRDKYKALDMARTDWPATTVKAGTNTFNFRVTAPHQGVMTLYVTNSGYNPTQPLKWSDLDLANPVAQYATGRTATNGYYTFNGTLPNRTGRQLVYLVWQRSDSPEAFYGCSDVDFGGTAAALAVSAPDNPSEQQLVSDATLSTVAHHDHGTAAAAPQTLALAPVAFGTDSSASASSSTAMLGVAGAGLVSAGASGVFLYRRMRSAGTPA